MWLLSRVYRVVINNTDTCIVKTAVEKLSCHVAGGCTTAHYEQTSRTLHDVLLLNSHSFVYKKGVTSDRLVKEGK